jgi:hypothetical protein
MNWEQSQIMVAEHRYLEGTMYKGKEITYITAIPIGKGMLKAAKQALKDGIDLGLFNKAYEADEFEVVAWLNFERHKDIMDIDVISLEDILRG